MSDRRQVNFRLLRQAVRSNDLLGLLRREDGLSDRGLLSRMRIHRISKMGLDGSRHVATPFNGGVVCMDLDKTEDRFLLAGGADTTLAVFNTHFGSEQATTHIAPIFSFNRQTNPHAHKFLISSVAWYPVDSGLFVTGSHDCTIKLWDTNEIEVVASFQAPKKVTSVAMSLVSAAHTLIACGCEDTQLRLCDPNSGAISHVFSGHRDPVWCVAWSAHSEFEVLSGDGGGQVRVWDIRRAGCRAVLDQYHTQRETRPASAEPPPAAVSPAKKRRGGASGGTMHTSSSAPALLGSEPAAAMRMKESAVRAHSGAVTCVLPCPDAVNLLTAGTDGRMRLWDAQYRYNRLVGYEGTHNRAIRGRQLAVTDDARVVFYPTGSVINVYEVETGRTLTNLQGGHKESINCCVYNPALSELYSGANDCAIRVWSCAAGNCEEEEEGVDG